MIVVKNNCAYTVLYILDIYQYMSLKRCCGLIIYLVHVTKELSYNIRAKTQFSILITSKGTGKSNA